MKTSEIITFRKQRELGQIIGDTFKFLRKNIKPMARVLVRTSLIPFILLLVSSAFYTYASAGLNTFSLTQTGFGDLNVGSILISAFVMFASIVIYTATLYGGISEYIKAYTLQNGYPDIEDVMVSYKKKMGAYIGLGFSQVLVVIVVAILCMLPGFIVVNMSGLLGGVLIFLGIFPIIYLTIRWSLIFQTMTHNDMSVSSSFYESGLLIKDFWWITFATILVQGFLIYIISFAFQVPMIIYVMTKGILMAQEGSLSDPSELMDWGFIALQTLSNAATYILYIVMAITYNLIFFNLYEHKTQSGSLSKIDTIGN